MRKFVIIFLLIASGLMAQVITPTKTTNVIHKVATNESKIFTRLATNALHTILGTGMSTNTVKGIVSATNHATLSIIRLSTNGLGLKVTSSITNGIRSQGVKQTNGNGARFVASSNRMTGMTNTLKLQTNGYGARMIALTNGVGLLIPHINSASNSVFLAGKDFTTNNKKMASLMRMYNETLGTNYRAMFYMNGFEPTMDLNYNGNHLNFSAGQGAGTSHRITSTGGSYLPLIIANDDQNGRLQFDVGFNGIGSGGTKVMMSNNHVAFRVPAQYMGTNYATTNFVAQAIAKNKTPTTKTIVLIADGTNKITSTWTNANANSRPHHIQYINDGTACEGLMTYRYDYGLTNWWDGFGLFLYNDGVTGIDCRGATNIQFTYRITNPTNNLSFQIFSYTNGLVSGSAIVILPNSTVCRTTNVAFSSLVSAGILKIGTNAIFRFDFGIGGAQFSTGSVYIDNMRVNGVLIPSSTAYTNILHNIIIQSTNVLHPIVVNESVSLSTNWVKNNTNTSGQFYAGVITAPTMVHSLVGGLMTATIGNGTYAMYSSSNYLGGLRRYNVSGRAFTLRTNQNNYIVCDVRGGTPSLTNRSSVLGLKQSDIIPVFTCYLDSHGDTYSINWDTMGRGLANRLNERDIKTIRFIRESGLNVTERPSRIVRVTSGKIWVGADNLSLNACDSFTNGMEFFFHTPTGGWTNIQVTQYTNGRYDTPTGLANVGGGGAHWTVNYIYEDASTNRHLFYTIGDADYTSLLSAQVAQPQSPPDPILSHGILLAKIIVQKAVATATEIDSAFVYTFNSTGMINHNELNNLGYNSSGHTGFIASNSALNLISSNNLRSASGMANTNYVNNDISVATNIWHTIYTNLDNTYVRTATNAFRQSISNTIKTLDSLSNIAMKSYISNTMISSNLMKLKSIPTSNMVKIYDKTATNNVHSALTTQIGTATNNVHSALTTQIGTATNNVHSALTTQIGTSTVKFATNIQLMTNQWTTPTNTLTIIASGSWTWTGASGKALFDSNPYTYGASTAPSSTGSVSITPSSSLRLAGYWKVTWGTYNTGNGIIQLQASNAGAWRTISSNQLAPIAPSFAVANVPPTQTYSFTNSTAYARYRVLYVAPSSGGADIMDVYLYTTNTANMRSYVNTKANNVTNWVRTSGTPSGAIMPFAGVNPPMGWSLCDGHIMSRVSASALYNAITVVKGTNRIGLSSTGTFTNPAHGLITGDRIEFSTTGTLPTGVLPYTNYYVIAQDANSFWVATNYAKAIAGVKTTLSGSPSGTHTLRYVPYGTSTSAFFFLPDFRGASIAGAGTGTGYTANETINLGAKNDDQMQGHYHSLTSGTYVQYSSGALGAPAGGSTLNGVPVAVGSPTTDGSNGTPRTGTYTRGKVVGVNFIIKQ